MGKSRARVPAFYRQSIQNAVNQQINIGKSKHRTMLNREAIGKVVSYCTIAAAHDLLDWGEKESTILTLKMNNAASRYILDHDKYGAPEAKKRLEERTAHLMPEEFWLPAGDLVGSEKKLRMRWKRNWGQSDSAPSIKASPWTTEQSLHWPISWNSPASPAESVQRCITATRILPGSGAAMRM